jgi:hypothetical protein
MTNLHVRGSDSVIFFNLFLMNSKISNRNGYWGILAMGILKCTVGRWTVKICGARFVNNYNVYLNSGVVTKGIYDRKYCTVDNWMVLNKVWWVFWAIQCVYEVHYFFNNTEVLFLVQHIIDLRMGWDLEIWTHTLAENDARYIYKHSDDGVSMIQVSSS